MAASALPAAGWVRVMFAARGRFVKDRFLGSWPAASRAERRAERYVTSGPALRFLTGTSRRGRRHGRRLRLAKAPFLRLIRVDIPDSRNKALARFAKGVMARNLQ
ncbi:hypothetical protein BDI4_440022 [Burkholderia diffusa]|nr:hypothetical protein BDI4_440022 [Burkholderia diffusa]